MSDKQRPGPKPGRYGKKKALSLTISIDLHVALEKLAAGYGISRSEYIERLILKELKK